MPKNDCLSCHRAFVQNLFVLNRAFVQNLFSTKLVCEFIVIYLYLVYPAYLRKSQMSIMINREFFFLSFID